MEIRRQTQQRRAIVRRSVSGFGMIEVMLSMVIIMVGLVTLLALFSQAIATTQLAQLDMIARQKAREALEAIYTARNTQQIAFEDLQNVANGGVFLDGFQPLRQPNPTSGNGDGLVGTADDGPIEVIHSPGPDGVPGNSDDRVSALDHFERRISLSSINGDLTQIVVEVRFRTPWGAVRNYQIESFISSYR